MGEPGSADSESDIKDASAGHSNGPDLNRHRADPDLGDVSPDLAARITAALELADTQHRLEQALTLIRAAPELAADAERKGVSARDRAEALLFEGDILYRMGRFAQALRASARALRLTPSDAHAWYNIATIFRDVGDAKRALRIAEHGLARATPPKNLGLLVCKGRCLMALRRY
jgi:tetratricopeptide (TPR) repeat protein